MATIVRRGRELQNLPSKAVSYNVHKVTNRDSSGYVVVAIECAHVVSMPVAHFWFSEPGRYNGDYSLVVLSALREACHCAEELTAQGRGGFVDKFIPVMVDAWKSLDYDAFLRSQDA